LLVEDSDDDIFFAKRAFQSVGRLTPLSYVDNGQKAIDYLSGSDPYSARTQFPIPSLVLLDIKLPFLSGLEVLQWIREQSNFPKSPVVMFTSSNQERDVEEAYALGANAYLLKPARADQYLNLVSLITGFWLDANIPPRSKTATGETPRAVLPLPVQRKI